jgi:hypothetical protein
MEAVCAPFSALVLLPTHPALIGFASKTSCPTPHKNIFTYWGSGNNWQDWADDSILGNRSITMENPEDEFSKYHDKLRSELNTADWHFTVFKYITEVQNNYLKELNQAPAFWSLTINAHLYTVLMCLNRFSDKKEKVKHLHMDNFLDFIEQNLDIFSRQAFERRLRTIDRYDEITARSYSKVTSEIVNQHRQKLKDLPISSLRSWRNTVLAHLDKDSVLQGVDITKKFPIKKKQIEEIIDTLDKILNYYSNAFGSSTWVRGLPIQHGIQYTLDAVRFKLQSESSNLTS